MLTFSRILQASTDLAATYAALILADEGIEITVGDRRPRTQKE